MKRIKDMKPKEIRAVVKKLKEVLASNAGEKPAMAYAGICEEDFELLTSRHPELIELAKNAGGVLDAEASMVIKDSISKDKDVKTARWYKEHTDPNFSKNIKVENTVSLSAEQRGEEIDKLFDKLDK